MKTANIKRVVLSEVIKGCKVSLIRTENNLEYFEGMTNDQPLKVEVVANRTANPTILGNRNLSDLEFIAIKITNTNTENVIYEYSE